MVRTYVLGIDFLILSRVHLSVSNLHAREKHSVTISIMCLSEKTVKSRKTYTKRTVHRCTYPGLVCTVIFYKVPQLPRVYNLSWSS